jgi:ABC-type antimicrobial peptide transport system permease subunit
MATAGIVAGVVGGFALAQLAGSYFEVVRMPGAVVVVGSAVVLLAAAVIASVLPAARAARVDVITALRSD